METNTQIFQRKMQNFRMRFVNKEILSEEDVQNVYYEIAFWTDEICGPVSDLSIAKERIMNLVHNYGINNIPRKIMDNILLDMTYTQLPEVE